MESKITDETMSERPFKVLGIQQIAIGGPDKEKLRALWVDTLGLEYVRTYRSETENVDEDIAVAGSGPMTVEVDLMQPLDPEMLSTPLSPPARRWIFSSTIVPMSSSWIT